MKYCIYVCPNYTENAIHFINKLASIEGVQLGLISQEPKNLLPEQLVSKLTGFHRVEDVIDNRMLSRAVLGMNKKYGKPDRILGAVEQLQVPLAIVREEFGIEGMSVEAAKNFRDKSRMKFIMQEAGLPCARFCLVSSAGEAIAFALAAGYPLIVKPPEGAASQTTFKVSNETELKEALAKSIQTEGQAVLLEEFIQGDEFSFDTFSLNGKSVFHSLTHYYPNPLEAMHEPWIQWQVVLPREVNYPKYDDIKETAARTLEALGMQTGMSHLEWFRRKDGSIAISEVAARPPGAQITTLISRANDIDCVTLWGRLMIFGEFPKVERKYAVGAAYLRGQGEGKVKAVHGLDQINREVGHLFTDVKIPKIGQEKSQNYEGEGFIILRHPETSIVKEALSRVVSTVRVELG